MDLVSAGFVGAERTPPDAANCVVVPADTTVRVVNLCGKVDTTRSQVPLATSSESPDKTLPDSKRACSWYLGLSPAETDDHRRAAVRKLRR